MLNIRRFYSKKKVKEFAVFSTIEDNCYYRRLTLGTFGGHLRHFRGHMGHLWGKFEVLSGTYWSLWGTSEALWGSYGAPYGDK